MQAHRGGYAGKILRVDLTTGSIEDQPLPSDEVLRKYVGGWGLALRYLYDMVPPGYSPTDPENPLIFMTGPATGLRMPGATNTCIATKNFDTGFTVGRSHSHGGFGINLKKAGYDGIIITGKSENPVYLWIDNGKVELRDASHLWGVTDTHETEDVLKAELGRPKVSVAAIGPAGEHVVAGGMICNDKHHNFAHCGVGSIAGSKKLKAIAVYGNKPIPVADEKLLGRANKGFFDSMRRPGHIGMTLNKGQWMRKNEYRERLQHLGFIGMNGTLNQLVEFGLGWAKQKYTPKPCPGCPVGCPYELEITTGPHKGYVATMGGGGEALEGAGSIVGVVEGGTVFYLTDLYDRLGLEGSMTGSTLAMAIEAYQRGLICKKDTDGLDLHWGDGELVETLARKMANREGAFGDLLARGIKEAAETIGGDAPSFAINVKGTGISLHEWRGVWGVLFGQIVSSGAGWPAPGADCFVPEPDAGYVQKTDPLDKHSKPIEARKTGLLKFFNDCTGFCWIITWGLWDVLRLQTETLNAATGFDYSREELLEIGERVMQLERAFNVRHGLRPEDDWTVPKRLVEAPQDGPVKGITIEPYLKGMVQEYHRLMGWDAKTGKPTRTTLQKAGLSDVAHDIWDPSS